MDFNPFRIKAFLPPLFAEQVARPEVVRRAVNEKPTTLVGARGVRWHIGNVEPIDDNGLYLRLGRTSRSTMPFLDQGVSGRFTVEA